MEPTEDTLSRKTFPAWERLSILTGTPRPVPLLYGPAILKALGRKVPPNK